MAILNLENRGGGLLDDLFFLLLWICFVGLWLQLSQSFFLFLPWGPQSDESWRVYIIINGLRGGAMLSVFLLPFLWNDISQAPEKKRYLKKATQLLTLLFLVLLASYNLFYLYRAWVQVTYSTDLFHMFFGWYNWMQFNLPETINGID